MSAPSGAAPQKPADKPPVRSDDALPRVEPPTAGFILQLFFIPMIIVMIIVLVWLMFSWLAHIGNNPRDLVNDLKKLNDASWQKALTLADLLRNSEHEDLKYDSQLAGELAGVLEGQMEAGGMDDNRIRLRMFLCRALGEFHTPEGLPALVEAAAVERDPAEADVRRTALEAIAVLASNIGPEKIQDNEQAMAALYRAASERGATREDSSRRAKLRERAAFTLGVVGGQDALDRLERMLDDPHANVRYNAAAGLARHGDPRAVRVLVEMLDPDNELAVQGEEQQSGKDFKRLTVMVNGIRAARQLFENNPSADLQPLKTSLENLAQASVQRGVRLEAQEALHWQSHSND